MSEAMLHADIVSFMRDHQGRANAIPRAALLAHLHALGHTLTDRTLRRAYETIPEIGHSCTDPKGLFWIISNEDRHTSMASFHSKAMACLSHEKRVKGVGSAQGQLDLGF